MSPVSRSSGSADGDGFGNPDHAVEHCDGNGRFALLAGQRAGAEFCADQPLVSADGGLRETTAAVSRRFLPGHPAFLGDEPDVAVARALGVGTVVLGTAEARGGMTTSGGGSCCRAAAAW
jgi:hypothetical protein